MRTLLTHNLVSLSMWYCTTVSRASWPVLLEFGHHLKCLELGKQVDLLKHHEPMEKISLEPPFQLDLPNLQKLVLNGVVMRPETRFDHLIHLKHLDLTACILMEFDLAALIQLPNLQALILFNVWPLEDEIPTLCKLKQLRTLDMSIAKSNINGTYSDPNRQLAEIVESLPYLTHLDLSGTNLAGNGVAQATKSKIDENLRGSDIPGLISRVDRPLQFLGLYNTAHSACRRYDIPALTIAGDADEDQILTAAIVYQDRQELLTKALNDLYHLLRFLNCRQIHRALDIVLTAMDKHIRVKYIQISGR